MLQLFTLEAKHSDVERRLAEANEKLTATEVKLETANQQLQVLGMGCLS